MKYEKAAVLGYASHFSSPLVEVVVKGCLSPSPLMGRDQGWGVKVYNAR